MVIDELWDMWRKSLIPNNNNATDCIVVHECGSNVYHIVTSPRRRQRWFKLEGNTLYINIYWSVTTHVDNTVICLKSNQYTHLGE